MRSSQDLLHGEDDVKSISEINVTPFIDVMLVLLIIFMVTAPLMMGGVRVNLPKTSGTPMPRPQNPLIVSLDAENRAFVGEDEVAADARVATFRRLAIESETGEVFVRGDGEVKYAKMVELMTDLGQAGFARVTLVTSVRTDSAPAPATEGASALDGSAPIGPSSPTFSPSSAPPSTTSASGPAQAESPTPVPAPVAP
jgi:biopolymer transport protein ExbD